MEDQQAKFRDLVGVNRESTLLYQFQKMVDEESREVKLRGDSARRDAAADRILDWIRTAKEYHWLDPADLSSLRDFVGTHRRACVWGVLLGLELAAKR